jgi:hypothetical protein
MLILPPSRETADFIVDAESPARELARIVADGQRRREFVTVDPRLAAECIMGAVSRVAIHRRLGTLPRRLAQYEREVASAVLATLATRRRRTA